MVNAKKSFVILININIAVPYVCGYKPFNTMIKYDRILFNGIFGLVLPVFCFLFFWWGSLLFTNNNNLIMVAAISGLGTGLLISLYLKYKYRVDIYRLSKPILLLVYLFYNFVLLGLFMGVPIFHIILGVIAGFYRTKCLIYDNNIVDYKMEIFKISSFTSAITGFICLLSAVIALLSKSTPYDLKGMFRLSFDMTQPLLISFIITGGILLIVSQYWLTKFTMIKTLKLHNINIH